MFTYIRNESHNKLLWYKSSSSGPKRVFHIENTLYFKTNIVTLPLSENDFIKVFVCNRQIS